MSVASKDQTQSDIATTETTDTSEKSGILQINEGIKSGESKFKVFTFAPSNEAHDTQKCLDFWDFIEGREDLVPAKAFKLTSAKTSTPNTDGGGEESTDWNAIFDVLKERGLDKCSVNADKCKICDYDKSTECLCEDHFDLAELDGWDPFKKTFIDVAVLTDFIPTQDASTQTDFKEQSEIDREHRAMLMDEIDELLRQLSVRCDCPVGQICEAHEKHLPEKIDSEYSFTRLNKGTCSCGRENCFCSEYYQVIEAIAVANKEVDDLEICEVENCDCSCLNFALIRNYKLLLECKIELQSLWGRKVNREVVCVCKQGKCPCSIVVKLHKEIDRIFGWGKDDTLETVYCTCKDYYESVLEKLSLASTPSYKTCKCADCDKEFVGSEDVNLGLCDDCVYKHIQTEEYCRLKESREEPICSCNIRTKKFYFIQESSNTSLKTNKSNILDESSIKSVKRKKFKKSSSRSKSVSSKNSNHSGEKLNMEVVGCKCSLKPSAWNERQRSTERIELQKKRCMLNMQKRGLSASSFKTKDEPVGGSTQIQTIHLNSPMTSHMKLEEEKKKQSDSRQNVEGLSEISVRSKVQFDRSSNSPQRSSNYKSYKGKVSTVKGSFIIAKDHWNVLEKIRKHEDHFVERDAQSLMEELSCDADPLESCRTDNNAFNFCEQINVNICNPPTEDKCTCSDSLIDVSCPRTVDKCTCSESLLNFCGEVEGYICANNTPANSCENCARNTSEPRIKGKHKRQRTCLGIKHKPKKRDSEDSLKKCKSREGLDDTNSVRSKSSYRTSKNTSKSNSVVESNIKSTPKLNAGRNDSNALAERNAKSTGKFKMIKKLETGNTSSSKVNTKGMQNSKEATKKVISTSAPGNKTKLQQDSETAVQKLGIQSPRKRITCLKHTNLEECNDDNRLENGEEKYDGSNRCIGDERNIFEAAVEDDVVNITKGNYFKSSEETRRKCIEESQKCIEGAKSIKDKYGLTRNTRDGAEENKSKNKIVQNFENIESNLQMRSKRDLKATSKVSARGDIEETSKSKIKGITIKKIDELEKKIDSPTIKGNRRCTFKECKDTREIASTKGANAGMNGNGLEDIGDTWVSKTTNYDQIARNQRSDFEVIEEIRINGNKSKSNTKNEFGKINEIARDLEKSKVNKTTKRSFEEMVNNDCQDIADYCSGSAARNGFGDQSDSLMIEGKAAMIYSASKEGIEWRADSNSEFIFTASAEGFEDSSGRKRADPYPDENDDDFCRSCKNEGFCTKSSSGNNTDDNFCYRSKISLETGKISSICDFSNADEKRGEKCCYIDAERDDIFTCSNEAKDSLEDEAVEFHTVDSDEDNRTNDQDVCCDCEEPHRSKTSSSGFKGSSHNAKSQEIKAQPTSSNKRNYCGREESLNFVQNTSKTKSFLEPPDRGPSKDVIDLSPRNGSFRDRSFKILLARKDYCSSIEPDIIDNAKNSSSKNHNSRNITPMIDKNKNRSRNDELCISKSSNDEPFINDGPCNNGRRNIASKSDNYKNRFSKDEDFKNRTDEYKSDIETDRISSNEELKFSNVATKKNLNSSSKGCLRNIHPKNSSSGEDFKSTTNNDEYKNRSLRSHDYKDSSPDYKSDFCSGKELDRVSSNENPDVNDVSVKNRNYSLDHSKNALSTDDIYRNDKYENSLSRGDFEEPESPKSGNFRDSPTKNLTSKIPSPRSRDFKNASSRIRASNNIFPKSDEFKNTVTRNNKVSSNNLNTYKSASSRSRFSEEERKNLRNISEQHSFEDNDNYFSRNESHEKNYLEQIDSKEFCSKTEGQGKWGDTEARKNNNYATKADHVEEEMSNDSREFDDGLTEIANSVKQCRFAMEKPLCARDVDNRFTTERDCTIGKQIQSDSRKETEKNVTGCTEDVNEIRITLIRKVKEEQNSSCTGIGRFTTETPSCGIDSSAEIKNSLVCAKDSFEDLIKESRSDAGINTEKSIIITKQSSIANKLTRNKTRSGLIKNQDQLSESQINNAQSEDELKNMEKAKEFSLNINESFVITPKLNRTEISQQRTTANFDDDNMEQKTDFCGDNYSTDVKLSYTDKRSMSEWKEVADASISKNQMDAKRGSGAKQESYEDCAEIRSRRKIGGCDCYESESASMRSGGSNEDSSSKVGSQINTGAKGSLGVSKTIQNTTGKMSSYQVERLLSPGLETLKSDSTNTIEMKAKTKQQTMCMQVHPPGSTQAGHVMKKRYPPESKSELTSLQERRTCRLSKIAIKEDSSLSSKNGSKIRGQKYCTSNSQEIPSSVDNVVTEDANAQKRLPVITEESKKDMRRIQRTEGFKVSDSTIMSESTGAKVTSSAVKVEEDNPNSVGVKGAHVK